MPRSTDFKKITCFKSLLISASLTFSAAIFADTLDQAQQSFDKASYPTAIIELKNILQAEPENAAARLLLGRSYLKQRNILAAIKELESAKQLGAPESEWLVPLNRGYLLSGKTDDVIASLDKLPQLANAEQAELLAIIGHAQLSKNQIIDAKDSFQQALSTDKNAYAKIGLARVAMLEQQNDVALPLLEEALSIDPNNLNALLSKSQLLSSQQQFQEAIEPLDRALEVDNRLQNARMMRSELYIRTNQLKKARSEAELLLKQNPNNGLAYFTLARLQLNDQQYAAAQTSGEKALRSMPDHLMSHFILGATHYAQQNFEQAQFYLEKFVAAQPDHLIATRLLGAIYLQLKDSDRAVELLAAYDSKGISNDAQLINLLGRAYLQSGDYTQGTETLNRALEINPDIQNTRTQLAIGQIASGDVNKAIVELENAIALPDATEQTSVMLILSYLNQQQLDKAFAAIKNARQQYPDNAAFLNLKGMTHENQQDTVAARAAYEEALNIDKKFIPALLALAKLDMKSHQISAARARLNSALEIDKNHPQSLLLMAQSSQIKGDTNEMIKWLKKARDRNSAMILPVNLLTNYYLTVGDLKKASSEASRYFTSQDKSVHSLLLMARVALAKGENDKASSYLQDVVSSNPKNINSRLQLAQLYSNSKDYAQALKHLDEVLALQPQHLGAQTALAGILIAEQRYDEAQQAIDKFSSNVPDHFMTDRLQGDWFAAQQQTGKAIEAYAKAFSMKQTPYLANTLSRIYAQEGNQQQAADTLEAYLLSAPTDHKSRLVLASHYQQIGSNAQAIKHYEKIAAIEENVITFNNLAWLYWLERSSKALSTAEKAYQLASDSAAVIDTYGWIMLHQGDKSKALKLIQKATSLSPANPDIRYHLAKALADMGDKDKAKKEISRLLRDYQGFEEEPAAKKLAAALE
ncbi:MAG: XrtA/PEP-CTERM system TPR-repeat protein PrsT [Pseudomonadales bacterium]